MANPSISSFLANFSGGYRPNRYRLVMTFPSDIGGTEEAIKLSYTAVATSIPTQKVGVAPAPYYGRTAKLAGDREFDDWSITVLCDNDLSVRHAFEKWNDKILGHKSNVASSGWSKSATYFSSATVTLLDREDNDLDSYEMKDFFPTELGALELAYDKNDEIARFDVTLALNYWENDVTS